MKTTFTSLLTGSRTKFSFTTFLNKQYRMLISAAFFAVIITSTVKAGDSNHRKGGRASVHNLNMASLKTSANGIAPTVSLVADYCVVAGKVRIKAKSTPAGASFTWSTGETGSTIDVDIANLYTVVAHFSSGDSATAALQVAEELVTNGDFSDGNTGFFSEYGYAEDIPGNNTELYPEGLYAVGNNGQSYHPQFFGKDHTALDQSGNYMIVNGSTVPVDSPARQRIIWQQTVTVHPNTNYYFSAYAMNINPTSPAQLQFEVNGVLVGTIADLDVAPKPYSDGEVNKSNWVRFYSNPTWFSARSNTAVIRIRNLNTDASGNDFGLDDISFSTLKPFITLVSAQGSDAQTICMNTPIDTITYSVGSDASGHSILNLPPGVTASFDVPNFLMLSGTPTAPGNYTYSITTTGTCSPITVTGTINIPSASTTWSGAVSNDWSDANNWSCGGVPIATTNVIIPAGVSRMPMLTACSVCKQLNIESGASLDLNGQLFTNYGGVTGNGVFKGSVSSSLTIDAAGTTSTVSFDQSTPGTDNALNKFTITGANNSVALNSKLALYGVLAPKDGTLTINDTLILRSVSTSTARVDVVTGTLAYGANGKVEVERYFPARRAWRMITSPLTKTESIFDSWQNGGKFTPGKGTYVSGVGATSPVGDNGMDWSPMNNSSLKVGVYLTPVLNTRGTLSNCVADTSSNIPYFIFVRGDRDPANTNTALSNNTTLSSNGKLQTGSQTFVASPFMGGFTFVGNPYAAPVDFDKLTLNNVKKHFWVWDPNLNTEQGGYILVEQISAGKYEMIPRSPSGMNQVLQSSQAFFVETASNNPASIGFLESAKSDAATNLTAFRPAGALASFRTNLYHLNDNDSTRLLDGVMALFDDSFNAGVDNDDVIKLNDIKETIALERDNKKLSLERRPLPTSNDTLFLRLTKTTQRKYRLEFEPDGMDPLLTAFLNDSYTGIKTPLSVTGNSVFDFEINGDAASAGVNRFRIEFKMAAVLPVTYKTITAKQQGEDISVNWTVENEINIKSYEVEKSIDGTNFVKVNTTQAIGANRSTTDYKWIDQKPVTGNNYYRVKSIGAGGKNEYSKTVLVKISNIASGINIFTNPAPADKIGVAFKNMPDGMYQARLINALGQTMVITKIDHSAGNLLENVVPGNKLIAGVYHLVVTKPDQTNTTLKVIVE